MTPLAASPAPSRSALGQATFQLWLVNVLVGAVVGSAWLVRVPEELSAWLTPGARPGAAVAFAPEPAASSGIRTRFML